MYDEWFVDGIVGEKEVNCGTALVVVMKAIALLCTLSNRLKYQTLLAHTHTLNFRGKKSMLKPYLSVDVPKSQRSHVLHLSNEYGCKPKSGYHSLSSHRSSVFFPSLSIFFIQIFLFRLFFAIANSVSVLSSRTMCSSFGTLKCSKYIVNAAPLKNFSIFLLFSLSLAP